MSKLMRMADRQYSLDELKSFLKAYDKMSALVFISRFYSHLFESDYTAYLNNVQLMARILNSVLMYANDKGVDFDEGAYAELAKISSSVSFVENGLDRSANKDDILNDVLATQLSVMNSTDHFGLTLGRIKFIYDWIEDNYKDESFKNVVAVDLVDILLVLIGSHFISSGSGSTLLDKDEFFRLSRLNKEERDSIVNLINDELSIELADAIDEVKNILVDKKFKFEHYSPFLDRPFLRISEGKFLLICPHLVTNDLTSLLAKLFLRQCSNRAKNKANEVYGKGFEDYVFKILMPIMANVEREPSYRTVKSKGVDFVYIKPNKIPLLIEVSKRTVFKSLMYNYDIDAFKSYLIEAVIPKFQQVFKWIKDHGFIYNGINLKDDLGRIQIVVCQSQSLPMLILDSCNDLLLELVNQNFQKITGLDYRLKNKNIYFLGINEFEMLASVAKINKCPMSLILFDYKQYYKYSKEIDIDVRAGSMVLRKSLSLWLLSKYDKKCHGSDTFKNDQEEIFELFKKRLME